MSLGRFLADLGSVKGAPGGGAAAALTAALGAALTEMTARLNDKHAGRHSGVAGRAAGLRKELQSLMDKDAAAFRRIQSLYKFRKKKAAAWEAALKKGTAPPLRICELCAQAAVLARSEKNRTSRWLESDRLEALLLLRAAFEAAVLNVEVNLTGIGDAAFVRRTRQRVREWQRKLPKF